MTPETAFSDLAVRLRRIWALEEAAGILSWDQETMMPPEGAAQRSEGRAALAAVIHDLRTDEGLDELIGVAALGDLDAAGRATVDQARRDLARDRRVPARLAEEIARATALGQRTWANARKERDFSAFALTLQTVLDLKREEAAALAAPGQSPYDALLETFEPGARSADIAALFARLRVGLADLLGRVGDSGRDLPRFSGDFPQAAQMTLARRLAEVAGYDFAAGRLDLAVHPFTSGSQGDVRITTRVNPADPGECAFSTLHETGHALYEQGIDAALAGLPPGRWASMGVHESQSRLWENQIGRGRPFCGWLAGPMREAFGDMPGIADADALYAAVNRVEPGFIRTAADEAQYNLHIVLRFDLERALIAGDLAVGDLEAAWNDRFAADFGRPVPDAARGVLQDVHWSVGLFGYFPTYALGNVYAAALDAAMRRDLPDLDEATARGDLSPALGWMRERVHRHGRLRPAADLLADACGGAPDEAPLLAYLDAKFGALYGV